MLLFLCISIVLMTKIRGGYTVNLMKLKLQGPSFAWASFKTLGGALVMCSHFHMFLKNFQK